jgi:hypothetical protein
MTRHVSDAVLDHWEVGATFYQGGYLDVVRRIGEKCKEAFHGWNVKTVVPFLDAVHHMLSTVQPREMGVTFDQKILNFNEWLLKMICFVGHSRSGIYPSARSDGGIGDSCCSD